MKTLTLTQPDDWHVHVRDGALMRTVLPHTARQFARAIIMPNLKPPVTTVAQAQTYREEILRALPENSGFTPLMTLYLTAATPPEELKKAAENPYIQGVKLYPAGATTNSTAGVADIQTIYPLLSILESYNLPLLIHGEVTDLDCDIYDREKIFIERHLQPISQHFPALRIVLEHITTLEAVQFVESTQTNIAATITPQHLLYNRNALLVGGIQPHHYCLPILKREKHRQALIAAATSGNPKFFLGTDSAPHLTHLKENACGCAGCFSAPLAIELYAEAFEQANALDKLEGFASYYGADYYQLPRNQHTLTLHQQNWQVPDQYPCETSGETITPLRAGEIIKWKIS